jgi:hypothetical protein
MGLQDEEVEEEEEEEEEEGFPSRRPCFAGDSGGVREGE